MNAETLSSLVNHFVGVPYARGGRDMEALDCWGLVLLIYEIVGRATPTHWNLETPPTRASIVRAMRDRDGRDGWPVKTQQPQALDLIADIRGGHIGLWIPGGYVLHAKQGVGVVCELEHVFRINHPHSEFYQCRS
jgi:hypothetical protein